MKNLIDTHAHITSPDFDADRAEIIAAIEADFIHLITVGYDIETSRSAVELAKNHPVILAAVGVHPNNTDTGWTPEIEKELEILASRPEVAAVGETGLDYYRNRAPKLTQEKVFRHCIGLAKNIKKPLIIHSRDSMSDSLNILREENAGDVGGILHCFSGTEDEARTAIELGFYISFAGNITYPAAKNLRDVCAKLPYERLLVETDCPWLSPQPERGKRNVPSNVAHTINTIASVRGVTPDDMLRIVTANFSRLFPTASAGLENDDRKIAYKIRNSLYLNITNQCTNRCVFCDRLKNYEVSGYNLKLGTEPTSEELLMEIGDPGKYDEIVFCGYGEPTMRLDVVKTVAKWVKDNGGRTRLNTNGHGNLFNKRNILPELAGLIDSVSVSLNADTREKYNELCHPVAPMDAYPAVREFIIEAKKHIPSVTASVVSVPGKLDMDACKRMAEEELGVNFRDRSFNIVG